MGFIKFTFIDVIDVLFVAAILYYVYKLIRGTVAINIFAAVLSVYMIYLIVRALKMELMTLILEQFIGVGALALIILFQQEIRRFLLYIGTNYMRQSRNSILGRIFNVNPKIKFRESNEIAEACRQMSESKTGALIVIGIKSSLSIYVETGDIIDASVSSRLLLNIFFKNAPMHDGAVIILNNKIHAARCILPVSENPNIPPYLGTRHRAAVGITEITDAAAVAVSEETGKISYAKGGRIENDITVNRLEDLLKNLS